MGLFKRTEKVASKETSEKPSTPDSSSGEFPTTGTIKELDGDVIDNVTGGVIASNDDDSHKRDLPYEVYHHYAKIQRQYEDNNDLDGLYEMQTEQLSDPHSNLSVEKIDSQKALRRANQIAVFFLITTDILGPSNAPYAISQLGLVPGIILYIGFGVVAIIGGVLLNRCFLKLDSNNYPVRTFSDLGSRIFGPWSRYFIAGLQFIQMIINVGVICLTNGQSLSQMINSTSDDPKLCFIVQTLVWALLGMILGQIRSLRSFSHLANSAVWMNVAICVLTMVGAATGGPNREAAASNLGVDPTAKMRVYAVTPTSLSRRIGGVNQMMFAWGGATMFCEVMAEMGRPRKFLIGMTAAELFIMVVYLTFGVFVYCYQGQFVAAVANQGIKQYGLQLPSNILTVISGVLAGVLYGNIGLKVLYQGFGVPDLKFPTLNTKRGALFWGVLVVVYWAVAWVIGMAIPQVNDLSSLVGALCILNFSYTLPAIFFLGLMIREDASQFDQYDPVTASVKRYDSWRHWPRWKRALCTGTWKRKLLKVLVLIMFLGGLTLCGLGLYGAITDMIEDYKQRLVVFSCNPTLQN